MNGNHQHRRGFTLIEALVSFVILAISLTVLFRTISDGVRNLGIVEKRTDQIAVARSLLASVGNDIPLVTGETEGKIPGGFSWIIKIHQCTGNEKDRNGIEACWVRVSVRSEKQSMGTVDLNELKLGRLFDE